MEGPDEARRGSHPACPGKPGRQAGWVVVSGWTALLFSELHPRILCTDIPPDTLVIALRCQEIYLPPTIFSSPVPLGTTFQLLMWVLQIDCVFSKFLCRNLIPSVLILGGGASGRRLRTNAFIRDSRDQSPSPSVSQEDMVRRQLSVN